MNHRRRLRQPSLRPRFHMKCLPRQMLASMFPFTTKRTLSLLLNTRAIPSTHTPSATTTTHPTPPKVLRRTETRLLIHHPSLKRHTIHTHPMQRCTLQTSVLCVTHHRLRGVHRCTTHNQEQPQKASIRTLPQLHHDSPRTILFNSKFQYTTHDPPILPHPLYTLHAPSPTKRDIRHMGLQEGIIGV